MWKIFLKKIFPENDGTNSETNFFNVKCDNKTEEKV